MRLSAQASLRHTDTHTVLETTHAGPRRCCCNPMCKRWSSVYRLHSAGDVRRERAVDHARRSDLGRSRHAAQTTRRAAARRVFGVALAAHTGQGHYIETYTGTRHTAALTVSVRTRERELRVADSDTSSSTPTEPDPARRPPAPPGGDRRTLDTLYSLVTVLGLPFTVLCQISFVLELDLRSGPVRRGQSAGRHTPSPTSDTRTTTGAQPYRSDLSQRL